MRRINPICGENTTIRKRELKVMIDDQLFLLAAIFAARSDSSRCETLWNFFNGSEELFEVICSLWPEMDDPMQLQFLFDPSSSSSRLHSSNPQDLLVELIETDSHLITMVEMDTDTVFQRCDAIKRYAKEYMSQVPPYDKIKFTTVMGEHMRKRLIVCNELNDELPMQYHPLWQVIYMKDSELHRWISGIVEPLDHFNKRLKSSIKIREFEKMDPLSVFYMIFNTPDENPNVVLRRELMPYTSNGNYFELFLDSLMNTKDFPLDTNYNFEILYHLLIIYSIPDAETNKYLDKLERQIALIIFKNGPNYLKIGSKDRLNQVLMGLKGSTPVGTLDITVNTLLYYSRLTDGIFKGYSVQDLYAISKDEEQIQESHFASLARKSLETATNEDITLQNVAVLLNHGKGPEETIFTHLSELKQLSILIEILLEMGNFPCLHKLISTYEYKIGEDVLVKYFWHFFNMAPSCQKDGGDLVNAENVLRLLLEADRAKYYHLRALIDVAMDVSSYSPNLGRGITFKPSHLLKFAEDPYKLISILLESDSKLYRDLPSTYNILLKMLVAFEVESQTNTDTEENFVKTLVLHINHALANMDFQYAYENTKILLKKNDVFDCWPTILQVGKFVDPNWHDGEIPTEIVFLQLEILGELLHICPADQMEAVTSQWSTLELELVTRDLIKDPFSLENTGGSHSLMQNGVSLYGVSSTIANLLSRG